MEHKPQKIEIKPRKEGEPPSSIHLFVDGHEIKGIRKLDFSVEPNGFPHLVLDLQAFNLTVDAACLIYQEKSGQSIYRLQTKKTKGVRMGGSKKIPAFRRRRKSCNCKERQG